MSQNSSRDHHFSPKENIPFNTHKPQYAAYSQEQSRQVPGNTSFKIQVSHTILPAFPIYLDVGFFYMLERDYRSQLCPDKL